MAGQAGHATRHGEPEDERATRRDEPEDERATRHGELGPFPLRDHMGGRIADLLGKN